MPLDLFADDACSYYVDYFYIQAVPFLREHHYI